MRTFLRLKNQLPRKLPAEFRDQDLRYADELVATFVQRYTRPGDVVLDPFAGYGTTLIVAEAMGREPYGVEYNARRAGYIRSQLRRPDRIVQGDSLRLLDYPIPPCDLAMTSPPFMGREDPENPLANNGAPGAGYDAYLSDIQRIYAQVRQRMKPGARAILEVSNLKEPSGITTLAWDVARAVGEVLRFEGEVVIGWDRPSYGYDHSYCLVFRR